MPRIICAECGQEFVHMNKNAMTCSEACRKARNLLTALINGKIRNIEIIY